MNLFCVKGFNGKIKLRFSLIFKIYGLILIYRVTLNFQTMQTKLTTLESIGSFIGRSEALLLKDGFSKKYPLEVASVKISKKVIEKVLSTHTDVCGIKFLYGLERMSDPTSKFLMLLPCTYSNDNSKPIVKFSADGFFTNHGNQIELVNAWEALSNYVSYMMTISPELGFEDVSRYCYFGKKSLEMLMNIGNVESVNYSFGFDDFSKIETKTEKYRIVLEPISDSVLNDVYMDHGSLLPEDSRPICLVKTAINKCSVTASEKEINIFRDYRDKLTSAYKHSDSIVEMYYQTTEALVDNIDMNQDKNFIYNKIYQSMFSTSDQLVVQTQDQIRKSVLDKLNGLINEYLLN